MKKILLVLLILASPTIYILGSDDIASEPQKINTSIDGPIITEKDKLCVIGDSGKDTKGRDNVLKSLKNESCTELRILGDVIYENGLVGNEKNKKKQFKDHVLYFKQLNVPIYLIMGNHDDKGDENLMIDYSLENGIHYPNHFYSEDRGNICFVSIFSDVNGAKDLTVLGINQREWFTQATEWATSNCNFTIGSAHHIYKTNGVHRNQEITAKNFFENEVVGKYNMFLSGHDHHLEDAGDYGGTRFLISGAAAKDRRLLEEEKWHEKSQWAAGNIYGYMTLEFNSDCSDKETCEATYKFYTVDDEANASMEHTNIVKP